MNKRIIYEEYDPESQYVLIATGSQVAQTALTGVPPLKEEERIYFYSTWLIIPEKGNSGFDSLLEYNIKDVLKVKALTAKKSHYALFTSIENLVEPLFHHGWESRGYIALLGQRKEGELKGFLLWIGQPAYVMGIWPIENHTHYKQTDKNKLQSLLQKDIKDFTNPKLWKQVYMFNHPSEK
ncbi:MAG: hypothetical protein ACFFAK_01175 [Promethearchaeota archaeon]